MKRLLLTIPIALIAIGAMLLFEQRAYAYADPGSGLLAIQAAGSALVATGWYLRRKIYAFLRYVSPNKQEPDQYRAVTEDKDSPHL